MRGLFLPLAVAVGSQVGAAYLDHALRWGTLVGICWAVYHIWRQVRLEQERRREEEALAALARASVPVRPFVRPPWWPKGW